MYQQKKINHIALKVAFMLGVVVLLNADSFAQLDGKNLIPNPGFESYKGKNPKPSIISAKPWLNVGTVDFYNKIDEKDTSHFKGPHSGKCYVGIRFQAKYKEYAYVKLTEPLIKDRTYFFSMYVRLLDVSTVSIKQLGVYLSDSPFKMGMVFDPNGLIDTTYTNGLSGNYGWMPITGKYKAKGKERYLIIGNFTTNTKEDFVKKNKWKIFELKEAFYYLDDVSLIDTVYKAPVKKDTLTKDTVKVVHQITDVKMVYFDNSSHKLQKNSLIIINQVVALLKNNETIEVQIKGYADNSGTEQINLQLSKSRAETVYEYIKKQGITNRISFEGFGSAEPIAPNDTEENRAKNRRVEILLIKKF